ncbi:hypothetical protein PAP_09355 [Palaeococcus pacificus DY20341]|uniref:ArsR family transcriptional regulator n=1 Tax=Palaeococcus pacificus DY20341 TaxID=1343739 RepID=A0A075LV85_9EURY|nr:BlaI/MecI/CopY family transcriptional regulator [Palaeococcus pacificus]AIF70249.1 hypothetical protein PAP_09355 [Palaeococcus pacificus DY20341]
MLEKTKRSIETEILRLLEKQGELTVAFLTRFLNEMGIECTRQKVEKVLRKLVEKGLVEVFYTNGNRRRHYRLVV